MGRPQAPLRARRRGAAAARRRAHDHRRARRSAHAITDSSRLPQPLCFRLAPLTTPALGLELFVVWFSRFYPCPKLGAFLSEKQTARGFRSTLNPRCPVLHRNQARRVVCAGWCKARGAFEQGAGASGGGMSADKGGKVSPAPADGSGKDEPPAKVSTYGEVHSPPGPLQGQRTIRCSLRRRAAAACRCRLPLPPAAGAPVLPRLP